MDGKFCVECGTRIAVSARFCVACGKPQPEITIPQELLGREPAAVPEADETAAEAAASDTTSAEADDTPSQSATEPYPVPELRSYFDYDKPQEDSIEKIPEPKPEGGLNPAYIVLIIFALFITAIIVWAIFAVNKTAMTRERKPGSSASISIVKPAEPYSSSSDDEYL